MAINIHADVFSFDIDNICGGILFQAPRKE